MTVWPYLPVWPFLLIGAALCCIRNPQAGISFALCIILVRGVIYFELKEPFVFVMVLYSVFAVLVLFIIDKVAGGFFALISVLLAAFLFGYISLRFSMVASEMALVAGMCASAFFGPTGGLYDPGASSKAGPLRSSGSGITGDVVSRNTQADHRGD